MWGNGVSGTAKCVDECDLYKRLTLQHSENTHVTMRQLPISYSSDGERLPRRSRARAGCVCAGRGRRLCLLELSLRRWRARVRALAMSSSHGNGMAARRASRSCTAVVAACRACVAADEACVMKMVLEASEVAHSVAYSSAET